MGNHTTIAIVWWSFAGLSALLKLRKRLWKEVTIKLFDSRENFCYIPALHEAILGSEKRKKSMQFSLKEYYWEEFIHDWVQSIDAKSLTTQSWQTWTFDYAVVATWSRTNFFWNMERKKNALAVRYADDIQEIDKRLHKHDWKNTEQKLSYEKELNLSEQKK